MILWNAPCVESEYFLIVKKVKGRLLLDFFPHLGMTTTIIVESVFIVARMIIVAESQNVIGALHVIGLGKTPVSAILIKKSVNGQRRVRMADDSMERALGIDERRAKTLINLLRSWQAKGQFNRASDRLKKMCDTLKDVREIAFLAYLDGRAVQFAEIDQVFEWYTGTSMMSVMEKLQAVERYDIKVPPIIKPN